MSNLNLPSNLVYNLKPPKVLDIATNNDPILKIPGIPVENYQTEEIQQLIVDMKATMYNAKGIGLAAPQIKQSLRIIVFYLPKTHDDIHGVGVPESVVINPVIEPLSDEQVIDYEGCLSIPGYRGKVCRYKKIRYTGIDEHGHVIDRIAEGWHARLVQHECDHLNGILYPELMNEEDKLLTLEEWKLRVSQS